MLRIIAGEFKGRRLKTPAGRTVRPTGDRVKEAWFSILQQSIPAARVFSIEHAWDRTIDGDDTRRYGDTAITFLYAPLPSPTVPYRPLPSSL